MKAQPNCNVNNALLKLVANYVKLNSQSTSKLKIAKSYFLLLIFCAISFFANAQNVNVIATHGTTIGSYPTLKTAFDAINAGTHMGGITINIVNNTTESSVAKLNAYDGLPAVFTSVLIQPSGVRTITGNLATALIEFNGSDYVTIDGLNTGGNSLTISNTNISATASTIRFYADAGNNTVRNCSIFGSSTGATTGTIVFSTGTVVGNDFNNFNNNNIGDAGNNFPCNSIYSTPNTAAFSNDNITINANNIYNYYSPSTSAAGIFLESTTANVGSSIWTITNNKFYQTGARNNATAAVVSRAIRIGNAANAISGSGYTITGNVIGYAASNASGTTNYGPGGSNQDYAFVGIDLAVGTGIITTVQNNTIAGISINSTYNGANGIFTAINVQSGLVNIGNTTGNKIGLLNAGISITTSGAQAKSFGIKSNQNGGTAAISNNAIINCTATSSTAANANIKFSAIAVTGSSGYTIAANTIGRAINMTEYLFYAIDATLSTTILNYIQGNTVEGVNINSTYNGATVLFAGINVGAGLVNIGNTTANTIGTLTNGININTSGINAKSYGIYSSQADGSPNIKNILYRM